MNELKIVFPIKFTQKDLESYLTNYWKKSLAAKRVLYDFSATEWISSEEITFLFSWIIKLKDNDNVTVKVALPHSNHIFANDTREKLERRKFLKYYLLRIWGMFDNLGLSDLDFENIDGYNSMIDENERFNYGKKIIPFQRIPTSFVNNPEEKVDVRYNSINSLENEAFNLEPKIVQFLNSNKCYSPFENKVISDIITKELVLNSMEHTDEEESYFTTALHDKWKNSKNKYFIDHFTKEKEESTLDFYKDKKLIQEKINKELLKLSTVQRQKLTDPYYPSLKNYDNYKNVSFLEFTYLDYGAGIHSTLKKQFIKAKKLQSSLDGMSVNFEKKHIHTQILEYAFLLESSKEPFEDEHIRYSELIPRGLYFILDMVRRYKGLLVSRSGYGKIIYDFSNKIKIRKYLGSKHQAEIERVYVAKEAIVPFEENHTFFPGTMVSIILPQRETKDFKKSAVRIDDEKLNKIIFNRDNPEYYPASIYEPQTYEFLNLAFEYQKGESESTIKEYNSKLGITQLIFKSISDKLKALSGQNCILFIDFEFIPIRDNNNILKILLYLSNNPMVNERTKVIVLNIERENLEKLKEYEISNFGENYLDNSGFLFKPIPCLRINKNESQKAIISDIQWIGVHNSEDLQILTNLFFGNIEVNKGISIHLIKNSWLYEGNVITKHNDIAYSIFTDFQDLINKAKLAKTEQLENWLMDKIIDGSYPKEGHKEFYFLTSKRSYQRKYLSLYETLNFKYTAKYFAQYLLDKYIDRYLVTNPQTYEKSSKFNKIIVVTVSSQLLGVEIRNLIKDNDEYKFLRNDDYLKTKQNENAKIIDCPKLIKLASYFSFDSEKPFQEIEENDKVLIVNDVISTGSLLKRLVEGIKNRNAFVSGVITIADSRKEKKDIEDDIEYESHFEEGIEEKTVSVLSFKNNKKFNLIKLKNKPEGSFDIRRINPILNAVISLKSEHTEKIKILYEKPVEFIKNEFFENNIFRIGHFKQNISHNSYFTDMHNLFYDKNGEGLLQVLKERIEIKAPELELTKNDFLVSSLQELKDLSEGDSLNDSIDIVIQNLQQNLKKTRKEYRPEFIFHPVYSGIEEVSDDILHRIFGTDKANILSLQRYETKNGWRFPFPAKRFNEITKNAHILILDSGALSGHSLVQLIDSISFLDVGRIDFLSVVGRIDDFQREFYSRLRSIKVKNFKNSKENNKTSIINLNILFGINLHIPPYLSKDGCPYCKEISTLSKYLDIKNLPYETKEYIKFRVKDIAYCEEIKNYQTPSYIPLSRITGQPDYPAIFLMRDKLGKVDSYRFYVEYFKDFDELSEEIDQDIFKDKSLVYFEQMLICVLHEPKLLSVIKDLLSNVYVVLNSLVKSIESDLNSINKLKYQWSIFSLTKLIVLFNRDNLYSTQTFEILFRFSEKDNLSLYYLSYILLRPNLLKKKNPELANSNVLLVNELSYLCDIDEEHHIYKNQNIRKLIKNLIRFLEPADDSKTIHQVFKSLGYFFEAVYVEQHDRLLKQDINILRYTVQNNNAEEIDKILYDAKSILGRIKKHLLDNLYFIKHSKLYSSIPHVLKQEIFEENSIINDVKKLEITIENAEEAMTLQTENIFDFFNQFLNELKKVTNKFKKDQPLYNFAVNYGFSIRKAVELALNNDVIKAEISKRSNISVEYHEVDEVKLFGHQTFMNYAFDEIIYNFVRRKNHNNVQLNFKTEKLKGDLGYTLTVSQNSPWISMKDPENGGFEKLVKNIFEVFCGTENFKELKTKNQYSMKIIFKNEKIIDNG